MSVPTRYNPKRLADYSFGDPGIMTHRGRRYRRKSKSGRRSPVNIGRSRADIEKESYANYKDFVRRDIDASEKRRAALQTMWRAEEQADLAAKKQAVDDYKTYMDAAPDAKSDPTGELRAAYMNAPLGKKVSGKMQAHIQASIDKSNRMQRQSDPEQLAQEANLRVGGTRDKRELDRALGKGDSTRSVAEKYYAYPKKREEPAPVPETAARPTERQKEITVRLPNGSKGTVTGKKGDQVKVMDRATRKEKWYSQKDLEIVERRGLDPITSEAF
jgi:hypothetical protein